MGSCSQNHAVAAPRTARARLVTAPHSPPLCHSDAFLEGYVQQFLYTFRYFCSPHDFLHFLLERVSSTLSGYAQDPTSWVQNQAEEAGVGTGTQRYCQLGAATG